jgi:hypothetical protein
VLKVQQTPVALEIKMMSTKAITVELAQQQAAVVAQLALVVEVAVVVGIVATILILMKIEIIKRLNKNRPRIEHNV